jgi:cell wall assembly regulator SMI1
MGKRARKAADKGAAGLTELLERSDRWLSKHRKRYFKGLRPGASAAECAALEKALGRPLPDELRTWLNWHNGQDPDLIGAFVDSFALMSSEDIARAARELQTDKEEGWQPEWIPFLDDGQGDYLCLDPGPKGTPVREFWRGGEEAPIAAPSLTAWVERFVTDLEAGRYHEDPERGDFSRE